MQGKGLLSAFIRSLSPYTGTSYIWQNAMPCESFGHDGYDCRMSNTAEPVAVRVPREWLDEAVREAATLVREVSTDPASGNPVVTYNTHEWTRCSASLVFDRMRSEGWTIEPPRPKAIRKPPLKGGIG